MVWLISKMFTCISSWRITEKEKVILERIKSDLEELTKEELEHFRENS